MPPSVGKHTPLEFLPLARTCPVSASCNLVNVIRATKIRDWIADAGPARPSETYVPLIMAEADSTSAESEKACGRTLLNASNGSSAAVRYLHA